MRWRHLPTGLDICRALAGRVLAADAKGVNEKQAFATLSQAKSTTLPDAQADRFFPDRNAIVRYQTLGQVSLAILTEGTLYCDDEQFFQGSPAAPRLLPAPATFEDLCWDNHRGLGTVAGQQALIETDRIHTPYQGVNFEITPWRSVGWGGACQLAVRYTDRFKVTEQFKSGAGLPDAAALAPRLAEAYARGGWNEFPRLADVTLESRPYARQIDQVDSLGPDFPVFGGKPKTEFPDYGGSSSTGAVRMAGKTYIARIGIGGVGWRSIGDYLLAFYDPATLKPVASLVVVQETTGLKSVGVSTPKPWVDPR